MIGRKFRRKIRWSLRRRLLQYEDARYARLCAKRKLSPPSREDMRKQVRRRRPALQTAAKGSLTTIAIYRNYNWENSALREALCSFGSVRHYDWNTDFAPVPRRFSAAYRREMNDHLLCTLKRWVAEHRPHLLFFYVSGESIHPSVLREIRSWGIPMINVSFNDREYFVGKTRRGLATGARDICRYFDVWWTSTVNALPKLLVEGAAPLYMPEAANPSLHRPFPEEAFLYDVSFVGARYGIREETIKWLVGQGVDVHAWGPGWPNGPLSADEMVRTYSRSRINLGFATVAAHDDVYCLKGRDFEVPMSGGLYLTQDHPELAGFFDIGKEVMTWSDRDSLLTVIQKLLADRKAADSIRTAARRRCLAEHSWEHRFNHLFECTGLL